MPAVDFNADRFVTRRWPYDDRTVRYVRSATGNDNNDGLTPGTAWQTLEKGLRSFAIAAVNKAWILDIAGTFTGANTLNIGGTMLGGLDSDLDLAATGPDNFISYTHGQIRAEPELVVGSINITGTATQATTGLYTVTVSNVLVAGAHAGQMLIGSGVLEWARISTNTTNTITVATTTNPTTWTGPIGIYTEGATIEYGDAANPFEQATYLISLMDWTFSGIAFTSNGGNAKDAALTVIANAPTFFQACSFAGIYLQGGPGFLTFDVCDFYDKVYAHDGASALVRNSTYRGLSYRCHGASDNGTNDWIECIFLDGQDAFGGSNVESTFYFNLLRCYFNNSDQDAIQALFGNSRISDSRIENTGADCIEASGPVLLRVSNVDGSTGNAGVGIQALNGAQVIAAVTTSVTGAGGDVIVGSLAATTYASLPVVDLGQLVRVTT